VYSLTTLPNGDVIAGGWFTAAGGTSANNIARWNGSAWSALGSGVNAEVDALRTLANGDLVAAGNFTVAGGIGANRIARWNGSSWSALGSGLGNRALALTTLPNGDLVASGAFTMAGAVSVNGIARWNGSTWSAFGGGLNGTVYALTRQSGGDVFAGGSFTTASGSLSAHVARLTTSCPASATTVGVGCSGVGGTNSLVATGLPWIGGVFTSEASGMPTNSLAVSVRGLSPVSTSLSAILPQGAPGCTLYASPDLLDVYLTTTGALTTSFAIPNSPALANLVLRQQVVALELDAVGAITSLTSTNALALTIGTF
jgi:hypothetical protein